MTDNEVIFTRLVLSYWKGDKSLNDIRKYLGKSKGAGAYSAVVLATKVLITSGEIIIKEKYE